MTITKILGLFLFTASMTFTACGGVEGDESFDEQAEMEQLDESEDALRYTGAYGGAGVGTSLGWSTCNVRRCKNACVDSYGPNGGGPLATCKQLCDADACSVVF